MENEPPSSQTEEGRSSRRGRLIGKLFGAKERKSTTEETGRNLNDFFHGPSDTLQVSHAAPSTALPTLAKLDISSATRYPQALAVGDQTHHTLGGRPDSRLSAHSQRRNRKGLVVRFVDTYPEIIGEGGDESEMPTCEISKRKKARPPPPSPRRKPVPSHEPPPVHPPDAPRVQDDFEPSPLKRTQTGYSGIAAPRPAEEEHTVVPGSATTTRFLDTSRSKDENRRSFIEIHQAEMREAEGKAFAEAARSAGTSPPQPDWEDQRRSPHQTAVTNQIQESPKPMSQRAFTPDAAPRRAHVDQSPSSDYSNNGSLGQLSSDFSRQASVNSQNTYSPAATIPSANASRQGSLNLHDVVVAAGDDALNTFVVRTRHLSELFRLHAETIKPVSACALQDLARAMLWWFLKGRMALELAIRERPGSPQAQYQNELDRQQAYANLAKGYWLSEEAIPEVIANRHLQPDPEVEDVRKTLVLTLKKLAVSMKRNGFLPPEEAFLPQHIDKSIWIEYPRLIQDIIALLTGNMGSAISGDPRQSSMSLLAALPLGDTTENFNFGRVSADVFLMEQGRESQRFYFPCLLSMIRPQQQPTLAFVLASQNGELQLQIQGNKDVGPTWDDVRWRNDTSTLDIKLPRGFILAVQCSQQDYRMLWSMFDFGSKVQATLYPRKDESVVFRSSLRNFQYFDSDPQSRAFPKEAVPFCDVALFEKSFKEVAAAGPRTYHRGFRVAVVTGPRTRTLSGVSHSYPPQQPVQFGFLRGERGDPALLLKFDNGREKGSMVLSFNDEDERVQFHSLLIGTALHHDETVYADTPILGFSMFQSLAEAQSLPGFKKLPWKSVRVINDENQGDDHPPTVLSDKLRVVVDFQHGTITDRVNVAPGELRVRLEVEDAKCLVVMRQPQEDMTIALSEAQVSRDLPKDMAESLQGMLKSPTIRFYKFPTLKDLHDFQQALTGCTVLFDGLAAAFAISRRRMVVPIHKKWEAGWTRIQVVQLDKVIQIVAFFADFNHGQCINFVLKGTDVFETFNRSGKAGIKIVDAKFPLPRMPGDGSGVTDDMGFVCLDLPDLPGEHDDISILFENESDRDSLCKCLPAAVKGASRLSRLK